MKCSARSTGRHSRLCLKHQYGSSCGVAREVEIEVRRASRRPRGAREHDPQHVGVLVVARRATGSEAAPRAPAARTTRRRTPEPRRHTFARREARERVAQVALEHERVVRGRLDAHQQAVERSDVDADRVEAALERLDERRPRSGERIEDAPTRRDMTAEELLDELRDVLAEIRMEAMDVPRPLPLGQVALRPREIEVEARVDLLLRDAHETQVPRRRRRASCL